MSVLSVFCNVVIPLLALLAAILSLIIDYLGYKKESESEKDRREKNPDRHVDAEEHHFLEARGEPLDDRKNDESKGAKKEQETNTQA